MKLKDKKTDQLFVVINTHFDHISRKTRQQIEDLIKCWIYENGHQSICEPDR